MVNRRPIPTDIPSRVLGQRKATIFAVLDTPHSYLVSFSGGVGGPEPAYAPGTALAVGLPVMVTWRQENRRWEILTSGGASAASCEIQPLTAELLTPDSGDGFDVLITQPIISPNGQFVVIGFYTDGAATPNAYGRLSTRAVTDLNTEVDSYSMTAGVIIGGQDRAHPMAFSNDGTRLAVGLGSDSGGACDPNVLIIPIDGSGNFGTPSYNTGNTGATTTTVAEVIWAPDDSYVFGLRTGDLSGPVTAWPITSTSFGTPVTATGTGLSVTFFGIDINPAGDTVVISTGSGGVGTPGLAAWPWTGSAFGTQITLSMPNDDSSYSRLQFAADNKTIIIAEAGLAPKNPPAYATSIESGAFTSVVPSPKWGGASLQVGNNTPVKVTTHAILWRPGRNQVLMGFNVYSASDLVDTWIEERWVLVDMDGKQFGGTAQHVEPKYNVAGSACWLDADNFLIDDAPNNTYPSWRTYRIIQTANV